LGGETPTGDNEGILVVEVRGASNGEFYLESDLSAGEYFYKLVKGSTGNWYLQSYKILPPPEEVIDAQDSYLTVGSYSVHSGQLPGPGAETTCPGPFTYELIKDVEHGALTLDSVTGSYTYVPEADYYGTDSFTYQIISDQCSNVSNAATVTIQVDCTTSQSSDSGSAFGFMSMLMMLFFILSMGSFYIYKDEKRG